MDFNVFQIILVLIVAFLAGLEGILDEFNSTNQLLLVH